MEKHFTHIEIFWSHIYSDEPFLLPHTQKYNEQTSEIIHGSDISERSQNDLYSSYDKSEFDDTVFDDDPICNDNDDKSIFLGKELFKSVHQDDVNHRLLIQNLFLKSYIINQDLQIFNISTRFLNYFFFLILLLFMTLLRHLLTNQLPLGSLTNHNPPIEIFEPKII